MSNRRPTTIASLAMIIVALLAGGATMFFSQESLAETVADKLSAFRKAVASKDSKEAKKSGQTQRYQRKSSFSHRPGQTGRYAKRPSQSSKSGASHRSSLSGLIPEHLFKRKLPTNTQASKQSRQQTPKGAPPQRSFVKSKRQQSTRPSPKQQQPQVEPLVVETDNKPTNQKQARKSPQLARKDELQEALGDLAAVDELRPEVYSDSSTPSTQAGSVASADAYSFAVDEAALAEKQAPAVTEPSEADAATSLASDQQQPAAPAEKQSTIDHAIVKAPATRQGTLRERRVASAPSFKVDPLPEPRGKHAAEVVSDRNDIEGADVFASGEAPYGQPTLDVHDVLLSEELYTDEPQAATRTEQQQEAAAEDNALVNAEPLQDSQSSTPKVSEPELSVQNAAKQLDVGVEHVEEDQSGTHESGRDYVNLFPDESENAPLVREQADDNDDTFAIISGLASEADQSGSPPGKSPSDEYFDEVLATPETKAAEKSPEVIDDQPQNFAAEELADVLGKEPLEEPAEKLVAAPIEEEAAPSTEAMTQPGEDFPFVDPGTEDQQFVGQDSKQSTETESNLLGQEPEQVTRLIRPQGDVLSTTEQPVIVSHVEGPRSIVVGKEASYRVVLENTSQASAQNLSTAVQVPKWAELRDAVCSAGQVKRSPGDESAETLLWQLDELRAHSSETIQLHLVPRTGRAFQLGVQWRQETAATNTVVEVQEPKLQMEIHGPEQVLFGSPEKYRLALGNPGTGVAENVSITLIPPGSDASLASTHPIGSLAPGEIKEIEMELTAREAGELLLQVNAVAEGNLSAESIKRVKCHKPELELDWRGPEQKYAGTESAYYFRVRNPGNAATSGVELKVRMPAGAKFLTASDSFAYDAATSLVIWRLDGLQPEEEQFMQLRCKLDRPGLQEFEVEATSVDGLLSQTSTMQTEVVALADLKLEVNDPRGAQPTGEPVTYEIRVENRGSTEAMGISIVGLFSEGIDPISVEGAKSTIRDGRVSFQPIKRLPPGGKVLLRIRAAASQVGTHTFRAEVSCNDLDIKLASEETTRFFKEDFQWTGGETPYIADESVRTIRR